MLLMEQFHLIGLIFAEVLQDFVHFHPLRLSVHKRPIRALQSEILEILIVRKTQTRNEPEQILEILQSHSAEI